ncbi:MAG: hypothetical protein KGM98_09240, partial [Bacteroidota bacterium]|nr:hypothetical protein [Bacteroidota bacterium]
MQDHKNHSVKKIFLLLIFALASVLTVHAQVSSVVYGKSRIQYKKFKWKYYQTRNFNAYFSQGGQELAKFVAQVAEEELPSLERFTENTLQRRANIIVYNTYGDYRQSNIGLGIDWQSVGGVTQLVNNKMVVYFDGNHADLRTQIREGIARVLTENQLFGENLGEVAGNKALLDLPQWLIDGYIAYAGQNWSTTLDNQLRNAIESGKYNNFGQFAFDNPLLAGHAFWYYIEERYKRENTSYLLYLARVYKSLNRASQQITKRRKFKEVLADFMDYEQNKYDGDVNRRKNYPKGSEITDYTITKRSNYFNFSVNPNKRDYSYAVAQYRKGKYSLILDEQGDDKTLLKYGTNNRLDQINTKYPLSAWDPKGTRLAVVYEMQGHLNLFVYDVITRVKPVKKDLTQYFDQVNDMKYMINSQTLLFSAVKNGHSDIYTYDIENDKMKQVTNDVYDDLDPSFVSFPGKTGIIFSSNRPSARATGSDTSLMSSRFNIFMITDFASSNALLNQITQLTNMKFGDARYPMQYNTNHFTFVSDLNGIANQYAGFFTTVNAGLDTLVLIGDEILRNPTEPEVDSVLKEYHKPDIDSVAIVSVTNDSTYVFPLSNYSSNLLETKGAGDNNQVSEVTEDEGDKILYKLRVDENTLRRRNVTARPTAYMKRLMTLDRMAHGQAMPVAPSQDTSQSQNIFQSDFPDQSSSDSSRVGKIYPAESAGKSQAYSVLDHAKLYPYKPRKFATDYVVAGFNNDVLGSRYQVYEGGAGPITLTTNNGLDGTLRMGTADIMEDIKFSGGYRIGTNLKDNDWLFQFNDYKRRLDWGLTYYRSIQDLNFGLDTSTNYYPGKIISNLYQVNLNYPIDEIRSIRLNFGVRWDKQVVSSLDNISLVAPDVSKTYALTHLEYVYDNTISPVTNIWNGIRYKAYLDWNTQISKLASTEGPYTFNLGFDARAYFPIYKNFIWAGRVAGDFSWGSQKLVYFLGGVDNWFMFANNVKTDKNGQQTYRYFNPANTPAPDANYAFQSLAVNLRGFIQNAANGNNSLVINSEFRLPVFTTLFDRLINNAFVRNFQLI